MSSSSQDQTIAAMSSSSRKIVLKSSDGKIFEMEEAEAHLSLMLKYMIGDNYAGTCLQIPHITGDILSRIIGYCRKHVNTADDDDDALKSFDSEFINVDEPTLFHMANAAKFLDIKNLSTLVWTAVADRRQKRRFTRELYRQVAAARPSDFFPRELKQEFPFSVRRYCLKLMDLKH